MEEEIDSIGNRPGRYVTYCVYDKRGAINCGFEPAIGYHRVEEHGTAAILEHQAHVIARLHKALTNIASGKWTHFFEAQDFAYLSRSNAKRILHELALEEDKLYGRVD